MKLFFVLVLLTITASAGSAATVTIGNATENIGHTFEIPVILDPEGVAVAGIQMGVQFDPNKLRINSVSEGTLFRQSGFPSFFSYKNTTDNFKTALYFSAIMGKYNVTAPGTFIILNVTALNSTYQDRTWLIASNQMVSSPEGTAATVQNYMGYVVVRPKADLNLDGCINLLDFTIISQNFREFIGEYDQDGDGEIAILDLVLIARNL